MKQQQHQYASYASLITSTLYSTGAFLGRVLARWMSSYLKWMTLAGSITLVSTCRYRSIRTLTAIRSLSAGHREQVIGWMSLAATLSSTLFGTLCLHYAWITLLWHSYSKRKHSHVGKRAIWTEQIVLAKHDYIWCLYLFVPTCTSRISTIVDTPHYTLMHLASHSSNKHQSVILFSSDLIFSPAIVHLIPPVDIISLSCWKITWYMYIPTLFLLPPILTLFDTTNHWAIFSATIKPMTLINFY